MSVIYTEVSLLSELKKNLILFMDELVESYPEESDFVLFRIFISAQVPIVEIMKYIVQELLPLKEKVVSKDQTFFIEQNILFSQLEKKEDHTKINHFKRLWMSKKVSEEDRSVIWAWFRTFILLAEKYNDLKKSPKNLENPKE